MFMRAGEVGGRRHSGSRSFRGLGRELPPLLEKYLRKGRLRLVTVDVNVEDVTIAEIEVLQLIHVIRYYRVRRNTGKLLFVRRVNRRSMRLHGRPASSWLRYAKNLDNEWVNKSVGLVKKLVQSADAVVIEDLDSRRLKLKLKSRDPEKALLFSSWPVAKIVRRITAMARKAGKLLTVPPHYSSRLCPKCNSIMKHEDGRWDRLRCGKCGFADDRDHVAVRNLARTALLLNGLHYLPTILGSQLRDYRRALKDALAQDPESQDPPLGGERGDHPPQVPPGCAWARGILGRGWLMNFSPMEGGGVS